MAMAQDHIRFGKFDARGPAALPAFKESLRFRRQMTALGLVAFVLLALVFGPEALHALRPLLAFVG
jgi:hypothetical protein